MKKIHEVIKAIDVWVENNSYNGQFFTHMCATTKKGGLRVELICSDTNIIEVEGWEKTFIYQLDISDTSWYLENILKKLKNDYYKKKSKLNKRSKYIEKLLNN